jgi:hypothetical protein
MKKNNNIIAESYETVKPSDEAKQRMLASILESNKQEEKKNEHKWSWNTLFPRLAPFAASLACLFLVAGILINMNQSNKGSEMNTVTSGYLYTLYSAKDISHEVKSPGIEANAPNTAGESSYSAFLPETNYTPHVRELYSDDGKKLIGIDGTLDDIEVCIAPVSLMPDIHKDVVVDESDNNLFPVIRYKLTSVNDGKIRVIAYSTYQSSNIEVMVYAAMTDDKNNTESIYETLFGLIKTIVEYNR